MSQGTSPLNRLLDVRAKIKRAKEHIIDLEGEINRFRQSNPYEVVSERDPNAGELVYHVTRADDVPRSIPLIAQGERTSGGCGITSCAGEAHGSA
jgi:hypothetical protein